MGVNRPKAVLQAAEKVSAILQGFQIDSVVIGAIAMAAHHYIRYTEDVDLGINTDLSTLRKISATLREDEEFQVTLREPDASDPLSGVIDVRGAFGMVQIVNFGQTFPVVIEDAWRESTFTVHPESNLRLAPLPHLIALKLYAGGFKSLADIAELLKRNPNADLNEVRAVCNAYRLRGLEEIISEVRSN